jgi:hypothetical protein
LNHHSFILSCWLESGPLPESPAVWRFSLENPRTAERRGFSEIGDLVNYLQGWTAALPAEEIK